MLLSMYFLQQEPGKKNAIYWNGVCGDGFLGFSNDVFCDLCYLNVFPWVMKWID